MQVCFPIEKDQGLTSVIFGHFGSAPMFLLVDIESKQVKAISNSDEHHSHGACDPIKALEGQQIDGIVVGNIGAGALKNLKHSGFRVYRAQGMTVQENVVMLGSNSLQEFTGQDCCSGHGHDHGCSH